MPRKDDTKNEKRRVAVTTEDVITASTRLFRRKGYHATTMEEIARRVGVRKGSLYHHIRSKEEVLRTILTRTLDRLIIMAEEVATLDIPPPNKLRRIILRELQLAHEHADELAVYLGEKTTLSRRLEQVVNDRVDKFDRIAERIMQEGIEAGVWRPKEPKIALLAIMGMLNWWPYWFNPKGRLTLDETAELMADYAESILLSGDQSGDRSAGRAYDKARRSRAGAPVRALS